MTEAEEALELLRQGLDELWEIHGNIEHGYIKNNMYRTPDGFFRISLEGPVTVTNL